MVSSLIAARAVNAVSRGKRSRINPTASRRSDQHRERLKGIKTLPTQLRFHPNRTPSILRLSTSFYSVLYHSIQIHQLYSLFFQPWISSPIQSHHLQSGTLTPPPLSSTQVRVSSRSTSVRSISSSAVVSKGQSCFIRVDRPGWIQRERLIPFPLSSHPILKSQTLFKKLTFVN